MSWGTTEAYVYTCQRGHIKYKMAFVACLILPVFLSYFLIWATYACKCACWYSCCLSLHAMADCSGKGDDGRGCVRAAHVIALCHGSPSPCWMTCGGVGPQLFTMTWEVTSLVRDRTACVRIENADGSSRSTSSSILSCSQMKSLWTAVSKDSNSLHREGLH